MRRGVSVVFAIGVCAAALLTRLSGAEDRRSIENQIPKPVANGTVRAFGRYPGSVRLDVAIGVPLGDKEGLKAFIDALYDPTSSSYKHYLTPDQFTERFGASAADYQKLVDFLKSSGLTVTATTPNRMIVDVGGSVADFERVFRFTMRTYQHPSEPREFHAPDVEPSVPLDVPILDIMGLDDYMPPRRMDRKTAPREKVESSFTGTGPSGTFQPADLRAPYAPGVTLNGAGQSIGLVAFGPYSRDDITAYEQATGLSSVPLVNILLDGVNGVWTPGYDDGEEALDIEMAIAMAPGLSQVLVYEGTNFGDIINRMATDNVAKQLSDSNIFLPAPSTMDQIFMEFAAQGQTFFNSSGDSGAYSSSSTWWAPVGDPYVTIVGGTTLVTNGPGAPWLSETAWNGSGGGSDPATPIPPWQASVSMTTNMGSTAFRNIPDVAMISDYLFTIMNGQFANMGGTSASTPLWAAFVALANQQAAANQNPPVGFLNPTLYALGQSSRYPLDFHDITVGNNTNAGSPNLYYAVPGYDLVTGWGTPTGQNLINDLAGSGLGTPGFSLSVVPYQVSVNQGSSGTASVKVSPYGGFAGAVGLTVSGLPTGVTASFSPSITASHSTMTITVPASVPAGSYVGTITASSGSLKQTIGMVLSVIAPVAPDFTISASPSILNVMPGTIVQSVIAITPAGVFGNAVTLSVTGAPQDLVASFSPATTASSSTLALYAGSQMTPGIYIINISASSGSLNRVSTVGLLVRASTLAPVAVDLSTMYNVTGIAADGTPFLTGMRDCCAYSANLLGSSFIVGQTVPFIFGPATNGIAPPWNTVSGGSGKMTVQLPSGQFGSIQLLASGVSGKQDAQQFQVNYSDGASGTFAQSVSGWNTPQHYTGETTALNMPYSNLYTGAKVTTAAYLYSYGFNLDNCKTVVSLTLPQNGNLDTLALTLVPSSTPCANPPPVAPVSRYAISTVVGSNPLGDNGPASQALLWLPWDVAIDAKGNLYIADSSNNRIRMISAAGVITTIAGTGVGGYSGDNGPATQALCNSPQGVTVDAAGNVYFSDYNNRRVRKIGVSGVIQTVAGNGTSGYGGDGGLATAANLNGPHGLVIDASGTLYIADASNNRVRAVTSDGRISTVAGNGTTGSPTSPSGDGGPANQAQLNYPAGLAIDNSGNILVADSNNHRVRRFSPGGNIVTIAGTGVPQYGGDSGPSTSAALVAPRGVAVDSQGRIYITDSSAQVICVIQTNGIINTFAGNGTAGFSGDNAAATKASLQNPSGIAVDGHGTVYVADQTNHRIRSIPTSGIVSTYAGIGHYSGDNGPAAAAILQLPSFLALDSAGNMYMADMGNDVVRKISPAGVITTIAGTGMAGFSGDGKPAVSAQLNYPSGLALDSKGNLYIADQYNNRIRTVGADSTINTAVGNGSYGYAGDGGPAKSASLANPEGISFDSQGNLYIADTWNHRIRMVTPDGTISTVIGNGTAGSTGDGGPAAAAEVSAPQDVVFGVDGTMYISEINSGRIRAVSPSGIVRTLASVGWWPYQMGFDPAGNVVVANAQVPGLQSVNPSGNVTTLAGAGKGFAGDGGLASAALLNWPVGLVIDASGNIYFSDQNNNRIRKLAPDTPSQLVPVSGDRQTGFAGSAMGAPFVVQVNGPMADPFPNVSVSFAVTSGGGTLSATQTVTGWNGVAGVVLTLPATTGGVTVTATIAGAAPVVFHAASGAVTPASLSVVGGDKQTGTIGSTLAQKLTVKVVGTDGNPFAAAAVTFAVASGSATLNPTSVQTASDGTAATSVALGNTAGPITITASVAGLTPVTFSITANVAPPQIPTGGVVSAGLSVPAIQAASPNAILSIFGQNFAPAGTSRKLSGGDLVNGLVPGNLIGVCVLFGTQRAPIFLVTPNQLNVQVPQLPASGSVTVQVITSCDAAGQSASNSVTVPVQAAAPEFFYAESTASGKNPVAATDGVTLGDIGDPARLGAGFALGYPGEVVVIYVTGLGLSTPAYGPGALPPAAAPVKGVTVSIDGAAVNPSAVQYVEPVPCSLSAQ